MLMRSSPNPALDVGEELIKCCIDFVVAPVVVSSREQLGHSNPVTQIRVDSSIELWVGGLHVWVEESVGAREIVVLFLIHFLLHDDLFGDAEGLARSLLVDVAGVAG